MDLTKNEATVLEALRRAKEPLKAYDLLDDLKDGGMRAPMTIYRALRGLIAKGLVHKIEALNAFVPCSYPACHTVQAFLVCESCSKVQEVAFHQIESDLADLADRMGFDVTMNCLEVIGRCSSCKDGKAAGVTAA